MIIARKNGTLISVKLVSETDTKFILQPFDRKSKITVEKGDDSQKVFDSVYKAIDWIEG